MAKYTKITWEDFQENNDNRTKINESNVLILVQDIRSEEMNDSIKDLIIHLDYDGEICVFEEPTGKGGCPPPETAEWIEVALKFVFKNTAQAIFAIMCNEMYKKHIKKLFKSKIKQDNKYGFGSKIVQSMTTANGQVITYIFSADFTENDLYEAWQETKDHFYDVNIVGKDSPVTHFVYDQISKRWIGF